MLLILFGCLSLALCLKVFSSHISSHCSKLALSTFDTLVTFNALSSALGLAKNLTACNCTEAAAWFCLLLVVLCPAIRRLAWAQRPRCCALSWQLTAIVYSLDYTWWPTFPMSCTCRLLKIFVLMIPPNTSCWMMFHKWQAWEPVVQHGLQYVHDCLTELLVCFKSVWQNFVSLCLEFVEHQVFCMSHLSTGLLLRSCKSLIL